MATPAGPLECEVYPVWPLVLRVGGGRDGVVRRCGEGRAGRLLRVEGSPILASWWRRGDAVVIRCEAIDPAATNRPAELAAATAAQLREASLLIRFMLGIDEHLGEFCARFRDDDLLGPAIRRRNWVRPPRRPVPWEALAWAVTEQLIETELASEIQRRLVARWGLVADLGELGKFRDVPTAAAIAAAAPAEIAACGLAPMRAISLIKAAREVASGRVDPGQPDGDRRLAAISGIGPWTLQCLAQSGRGDHDALPAGDLAYIKLVGRLADLGRRAEVEEVERFFDPYDPYRGLAGYYAKLHYHLGVAAGPPSRLRSGHRRVA